MVTDSLVRVRCTVCGGEEQTPVCTAAEVQEQIDFLRAFHARRLQAAEREALSDRADFTQDYVTDIVSCERCGLVFRSPRPDSAAITRAYRTDHYGHRRLSALFDTQVRLYRGKAGALAPLLPPGSRVLEVGSFVGGFLAAGRERGWQVLGVDPGEEVDTFCAERGLPVMRGTLPELDRLPAGWEPGTVDCVAIWNAFDQLPNPEPTLAAARRLLRTGGTLLIRVPNGECYRRAIGLLRRIGSPTRDVLKAALAWNNLLAFPYLHGYSLPTLDWMLSWHGFEPFHTAPDTLCRLADQSTKGWAVLEERLLKVLVRTAASAEWLRPHTNLMITPWMDVWFRAL